MIRVFPRQTSATPTDNLAYYDAPPAWYAGSDKVNVSCTFTYDRPQAEQLAKEWKIQGYNVSLGGPAYGDAGGDFVPGRFIKPGFTMTSRGCNNKCWFCYVWKREGKIRELPITEGYNVLDSNLLQCSDEHIRKVFAMLKRQPQRAEFTGGLEAARLQDWHVDLLADLKPRRLYFAYDTPDDYEPLRIAASKVVGNVFSKSSHDVMCYVLIGWARDTFDAAEARLKQVMELGLTPMAMLFRDDQGQANVEWRRFQRKWARPSLIYGNSTKAVEPTLF